MRRRLPSLLLLAASLAASLAAAELACRRLRPAARRPFLLGEYLESERGKFCRYDPELGWTGKPGAEDDFTFVDCRCRVRQNRWGFRGAEHPLERTGKRRVVVLGDSFVWGFGVEEPEIFTSVVERESRLPAELVNLGVSGYGTDQEYLLWRSLGRKFRPDEVLLAVTPYTDLWEDTASVAYDYPKPVFRFSADGSWKVLNRPVPRAGEEAWRPARTRVEPAADEASRRPALARLAARSALISTALQALGRHEGLRRRLESRGVLPQRDHHISWEPMVHLEPPTAEAAAGWAALFRLVALIRKDAEAGGAKLSVLVVPTVAQVYPDLWDDFVRQNPLPPGARWDREAPNRRIEAFCRENGIPLIDPLPALREAARTDLFLYYPWNSHWTAAGHRLVARQVLDEMGLSSQGSSLKTSARSSP